MSQNLAAGRARRDLPERVLLKLPAGTLDKIDAIVGPGQRSAFIREAIDREIERRGV